jgi:hypothetical protein
VTASDANSDLRALAEAALSCATTVELEGRVPALSVNLARAIKRIAEICDEHDFDAFERVEAIREVLDGR